MQTFIIIFLAVILGLIAFVTLGFLFIRQKLISTFGRSEYKELVNAAKNASNLEKEEYSRVKDVMGLTSLLEPEIKRDFPEFNSTLLFHKVENALSAIFNSLESHNVSSMKKDKELDYMTGYVKKQIEDMESDNTTVKFDDVQFNGHAIKEYKKENGTAVITVITSLSYYYDTNKKNIKKYNNLKKETRYITKFVYVYDESKFKDRQLSFSVHCPNCGAPLKRLDGVCEYCGSGVERINLKAWKLVYYKERG